MHFQCNQCDKFQCELIIHRYTHTSVKQKVCCCQLCRCVLLSQDHLENHTAQHMKDAVRMQPETKDSSTNVTLDDALVKTKFGKFNYFLIVLTGAVLGCVFLETLSLNVILPVAQCDLKLTNENKGLLSTIGLSGLILSSHLWGFLADTIGRKNVVTSTLFVAFGITIISAFAQNFWFLLVLRFLNGFVISGPSAIMFAYLGEFHCLDRRSQVILLGSTTYGFFCLLNPIFALTIINADWAIYIEGLDLLFKPWRLFILVCGTPSLVCGIIMLFMPESPTFTFSNGDEQNTLKILAKIYASNTGEMSECFGVVSLMKDDEFNANNKTKSKNFFKFVWTQTVPLFVRPHLRNLLTVSFIQFCIMNSSNGFFTFFLEISNKISQWRSDPLHVSSTVCQILEDMKNITVSNSTLCISKLETSAYQNLFLSMSIFFVGWLLIALIINRLGKLIIIVTLLFSCGACAFALMFVDIPLVSNYLYVVLLSVGLAMTVINATTVELFPTKYRAMALCLSLMIGRLGGVVGSNIIGTLLEDHCNATFIMPSVLLILSGCLAFTIPNISTRSSS